MAIDFDTDFPNLPAENLITAWLFSSRLQEDGNWIVVGSHSPPTTASQCTYATAQDTTGLNWISIPYHTTASSLGRTHGRIPNCAEVDAFRNRSTPPIGYYDGVDSDFPFVAQGKP